MLDSIAPPSDEDLQASIVDHWEPSAIVTMAVLLILSGILIIGAIAFAVSRTNRMILLSLVVLTLVTGGHWLLNHIILSNRTEMLTGIRFSGFYGLF